METWYRVVQKLPSAVALANAAVRGGSPQGRFPQPVNAKRKDVVVVKKSVIAALCVFLAAAAGALGAAFFYLRRREAELDEYEQLLYADDDFDADDDEPTYEPIQDVAPAAETDPGAEGAAQ